MSASEALGDPMPLLSRGDGFRVSSFCTSGGCVEVAPLPGGVAVRDSKSRDGAPFVYSKAEWRDFIAGVKNGEFDF